MGEKPVESKVISLEEQPWISTKKGFLRTLGIEDNLLHHTQKHGFLTDLIRALLKVDRVEAGRITCFFTVKSPVTNPYNTLHGGAVATVAELVAMACVRTLVAEPIEIFLGESSISYIAAARLNVELEVDGSVVKHGRRVMVCQVDFRIKGTKQVVYQARITFYNMLVANL